MLFYKKYQINVIAFITNPWLTNIYMYTYIYILQNV